MKIVEINSFQRGVGKRALLTNLLLGLVLNGEQVRVVNLDPTESLYQGLSLPMIARGESISYAHALHLYQQERSIFIQEWQEGVWDYLPGEWLIINHSWEQEKKRIFPDSKTVWVVNQEDKKSISLAFKEGDVVVSLDKSVQGSIVFPTMIEVAEGLKIGRPYLYFNGESPEALPLWRFFETLLDKIEE